MSLEPRSAAIAKIAASAACNSLASLRFAITDAFSLGFSTEEIQEILTLAKDIQQQPVEHAAHLIAQLLREAKKEQHHVHSDGCGCGKHHA
jgi:alkylhydroperoxidase/carboxymuconolactone decarboxylase family protein YurZ